MRKLVLGLQSNEEAAVSRAKNDLKTAENNLRDAQKTLDSTPRASNGPATSARNACQREVASAKSALAIAESNLRLKS